MSSCGGRIDDDRAASPFYERFAPAARALRQLGTSSELEGWRDARRQKRTSFGAWWRRRLGTSEAPSGGGIRPCEAARGLAGRSFERLGVADASTRWASMRFKEVGASSDQSLRRRGVVLIFAERRLTAFGRPGTLVVRRSESFRGSEGSAGWTLGRLGVVVGFVSRTRGPFRDEGSPLGQDVLRGTGREARSAGWPGRRTWSSLSSAGLRGR